jgi:signal transduction histidine kinase
MSSLPSAPPTRWQRFSAESVRVFHAYGTWLIGITWKKFIVLSILLIIATGIFGSLLPVFRWTSTEPVDTIALPRPPAPPRPPAAPKPRQADPAASAPDDKTVSISIGKDGVRIIARPKTSASEPHADIRIDLPPEATGKEVAEAVQEASREIVDAINEKEAEKAADAEIARADREATLSDGRRVRVHRVDFGDGLMSLAMLFIASSAILKITYKGRVAAEAKAAAATETAEAESLKRQVVEARMAAMQAQVEPHFLFNTLASIEHLIETDPPRAGQMQRNLIALLRAAMPTMREANGDAGGVRDLGRELAVIRPYLEILKVRMEERLATDVRVPAGLESAEFPPMMLQGLVENAIKHGLEPKPEGGRLTVSAEIVHGRLAVTVADTGLGFGKGATQGTGIGLSNIRERLALLYGKQATLNVAENPGGGTVVTITVPYKVHSGGSAATMGA